MSDSFAQRPWSPDGTHVVSVSSGAAVRIWNAATGECLHTLEGEAAWQAALVPGVWKRAGLGGAIWAQGKWHFRMPT